MVPERLLQYAIVGNEAVPAFCTEADHPWLRTLTEEYERFDGRKVEALRERLREPLPCWAPEGKAKLAAHVLERLCRKHRPPSPLSPQVARKTLFGASQRMRLVEEHWERERVVAAAAAHLRVSPAALLASLFSDLPHERLIALPQPIPSPGDLALRVNLALAQGMLQRAAQISIDLEGNARAVVRQILLQRLLCTVRSLPQRRTARLEISGPYSIFKRTILYGRAIASILPILQRCDRFELNADAFLRGRFLAVAFRSGDPVSPSSKTPRRYDSKLEERFASDLRRVAGAWDLIREPQPLRAGDHLIFPDFAVQHRRDPRRRALIEIVGFWTTDYLRRKMAGLRSVRGVNLILCIDEDLNCAAGALPADSPVVFYRRRIDVSAVLAKIEELCAAG